MAHTEDVLRRLREVGIHDASEAHGMAQRAAEKADIGLACDERDDFVAMVARWRYNAAVRGEIQRYRARCQSPPPPSLTGDDEEFVRSKQFARHLPSCPHCKGVNLEQAAIQTRSADEGPSIYMKCITCEKIVRPHYHK